MSKNVYEIVTNEIIKRLEQGVVPWIRPWGDDLTELDYNGVSKKAYRGINTVLLGCRGYAAHDWYSFRQMAALGGHLKDDKQHASLAVFYKVSLRSAKGGDEADGDEIEGVEEEQKQKMYLLRFYNVFNREQIVGLPELPKKEDKPREFTPIEACEKVVQEFKDCPDICYGGNRAFYSPMQDFVKVPQKWNFHSVEEYYSTLFHELVHSTGHESRTGRTKDSHGCFGSQEYAREELCAEIGSAMLCNRCGIAKTLDNSAAYIGNWLGVLKKDMKCVVVAAQRAQKAVDYILGFDAAMDAATVQKAA